MLRWKNTLIDNVELEICSKNLEKKILKHIFEMTNMNIYH